MSLPGIGQGGIGAPLRKICLAIWINMRGGSTGLGVTCPKTEIVVAAEH